jgi:Cu2+-exporting ATPase
LTSIELLTPNPASTATVGGEGEIGIRGAGDRHKEARARPELASCPLPGPSQDQQQAWNDALDAGLCLHCQCELGRYWQPETGPFCCRGCQSVHQLIYESGLDRYYDIAGGRRTPAATLRSGSFAWLDRLLEDEGVAKKDSPFRLSLDIQGVHCAACIWLLEELFRRQPGGLDLRINPTLGKVDLVWDATRSDLKHYLDEIEKFGYRLGPSSKEPVRRTGSLLIRMAVSIALALNVMMFSISYYFGLAPEDGALYRVFGVLNFALATLALAVGGQVFFKGALAGLRRRMAHLDLPISVGIALAWAGSVYAYFTLMLIGRWAQEHILERNRNSLLNTNGAERLVVKRQGQGRLETIAAPEVVVGDELWIAPGDLQPVNGILLRQSAQVSLDWITGESDRIDYEPGGAVPAGAFNAGDRGFTIAASQNFHDSKLHDLLRGATTASESYRARWWTWVGTGYVAAVLALAATGFLFWARHDPRLALEVTVSILVVTCPCALGLASPLAQETLHHALRKRGVFLRSPGFMDRALAVRKILLDKTGTLTLGHLVLEPSSRKALWQLDGEYREALWNMTTRSNHPVSRALVLALGAESASTPLDTHGESVREVSGCGLEWQRQDVLFRLGRPDFAIDRTGDVEIPLEASGTVLTANTKVVARFRFAEALKEDAAGELDRLHAAGYEVHMLSGDSPAKVAAAGKALGIDPLKAHGGLEPEEKAALVRRLDDNDTLMVGDGLNDSPSFEAALCTATPAIDRPALPGKADFYFLGDGIVALRLALGAARRLRHVVRDNLILAAIYNLAAVGLCFAGLVTPVIAAILMPLSSVGIVSLTAYRLTGRSWAWTS